MQPASRTPEGEPNLCPICGKEVRLEPSRPPGDAPCPHCGHLLWYPLQNQSATVSVEVWNSVYRLWTNHIAQVPDDRYLAELISGLSKFMAARWGAIWIVAGTRLRRQSKYQDANFPETLSDRERGNKLLLRVAFSGESFVSRPSTQAELSEDRPYRNSCVLLAVPIRWKGKTVAIIEIAQEPGGTVDHQESNLQFLKLIATLVRERVSKLVVAGGKKRWWQVWKK